MDTWHHVRWRLEYLDEVYPQLCQDAIDAQQSVFDVGLAEAIKVKDAECTIKQSDMHVDNVRRHSTWQVILWVGSSITVGVGAGLVIGFLVSEARR